MPPPDFYRFLDRSLNELRVDEPDVHNALARSMGDLRARLVADGTVRTVWLESPDSWMYEGKSEADIEVAFDRRVILDLIDGRVTLERAIFQERLRMRGSADAVQRFHDVLLIYLEGLIRMPGTSSLLKGYREE
jgi:hypothetical protein